MSTAIAEARRAARAAGLVDDDAGEQGEAGELGEETLSRRGRGGARLTSFTFHLGGLESAVQAGRVEEALNALPGVQARVVYSTSMAWVTAPESLQPDVLRTVIADAGADSWLTLASLRRRSERLSAPSRLRRPARRRPSRVSRGARDGTGRGTGGPDGARGQSGVEVLYTARALITVGRLLVALALGVPVVVLQLVPAWQFTSWQWVCLALSVPVVFWCAWPFHRAMLGGLRRRMPALDAASSVAILLAFTYSAVVMVTGEPGDPGWRSENILTAWGYQEEALFLDVACGCTILLLLGRLASRRTRLRSLLALNMLPGGQDVPVTVVRKDRRGKPVKTLIAPTELRVGDDVLVPTGAVVPCDGEVVGGRSVLQSGPFTTRRGGTGETPVEVGDEVFAGSRNTGESTGDTIKVRVNRTGSQTRIAGVRRWIASAEREENRLEQLATRTASVLVPWAMVVASLAAVGWLTIGDGLSAAVATALTVLVTVAPVALAVSTTLALRFGLARAAADGILIRDTGTVHRLAAIDSIIFNRAGTLTTGRMNVVGITAASGENSELVLRVAGALSLESGHAVSRAIVRADRESRDTGAGGSDVPHWLDVGPVEVDDQGAFSATVDLPAEDGETRPVRARLWRPRDLSELTDPALANAALGGGAPLVVSWKGRARGVINLADTVKPDTEGAVQWLEEAGVETYMLSRDTYPVARRMADSVGISTVLAGIVPSQKARAVRNVHAHGSTVALVGDRDILDCLAVADVGILMGSGDRLETIDSDASDVVVIRDDIAAVPEAVNLVRRVRAVVDWNLWLAWGYNLVALVLAVAGVLNPLLGTALMLGSSLLIEWRSAKITHRDFSVDANLVRRGDTRDGHGDLGRTRRGRLLAWAGENLSPWQFR
ncbi:HAD family hydrolase [Corynebacterium sp.]|uniref:heavy metal translocating P-type ATPase n=1 Tax=Corynebacterium sp. TaxID=1720 RepID=UPI0025B7D850|nr:HAD family hydrolase [Corynebacterium sp.]